MRIAGHSSMVISQRYVHPSPEIVERAFERFQLSTKRPEEESKRPPPALVSATSKRREAVSVEGPVAQRSEQGTHNPLVGGSNPSGPTRIISCISNKVRYLQENIILPFSILALRTSIWPSFGMVSVRDAVKRAAQWQPSFKPPLGMGPATQSSGRPPISTCPPRPFMKAQWVSPALGKLSGALLEFKLFRIASSNECKQVLIRHW